MAGVCPYFGRLWIIVGTWTDITCKATALNIAGKGRYIPFIVYFECDIPQNWTKYDTLRVLDRVLQVNVGFANDNKRIFQDNAGSTSD